MNLPFNVDWLVLAGVLLLLGFPPSLWLKDRFKRYLARPDATGEFRLGRGAVLWQNWVDLVRGAAGTYLLMFHAFEGPEEVRWTIFGWQSGILLCSLLIQTVRRHRRKGYFLAPVFFVWGITLVLAGPLLALYGILAGILVANVAENLEWKLPVMAAVIGVAGFFLSGLGPTLFLTLALIIFPLIVTFCGGGRMAFLMPEEKRK